MYRRMMTTIGKEPMYCRMMTTTTDHADDGVERHPRPRTSSTAPL
jgi:hypothetical protein